jgi:hypothetical protein
MTVARRENRRRTRPSWVVGVYVLTTLARER